MKRQSNLSVEELALVISLLDEPILSIVMGFLDSQIKSGTGPDNKSRLNGNLPVVEQSMPDIIDFKRSRPFGVAYLIGQAAVLRTKGYQLHSMDELLPGECYQCKNKTAVSLTYVNRNHPNDSHDFELCLSCYTTFKLTPVYASAESEV